MKKVILSAVLGLFVFAGTSLVLAAGEGTKASKGSCCSSATTVMADAGGSQAVLKAGCGVVEASETKNETASKAKCSDTAAKAASGCADTATASKAASGCADTATKSAEACADTAAKAASDCTDTAAVKSASDCGGAASASTNVEAVPGDCVKLPSGVNTSSASAEKK